VTAGLQSKPSRLLHSFSRLLVRGPGRPTCKEQNYIKGKKAGIRLICNKTVNQVGGRLKEAVSFDLYTKMEKPQEW